MHLVKTVSGWDILPKPMPVLPSRHVRVEMIVAGLCRTDMYNMEGLVNVPIGQTLGHEGAGVVSFIPKALESMCEDLGIKVGFPVALFPFVPCFHCACLGGVEKCMHMEALGTDLDGVFAPFVDVSPSMLFPLPHGVNMLHGAYMEPVAASMSVLNTKALSEEKVGVVGEGRIGDLTEIVLNSVREIPVMRYTKDVFHDDIDVLIETKAEEDLLLQCAKALRGQGTLIAKSRPFAPVLWPHQLITMKELNVVGARYGAPKEALLWMEQHAHLITQMLGVVHPFDKESVQRAIESEKSGEHIGKQFFNLSNWHEAELRIKWSELPRFQQLLCDEIDSIDSGENN